MISPNDEEYLLSRAYIPEHLPVLMAQISHGEPFLIENYLVLQKDNWVIFIGYPLDPPFQSEHCTNSIHKTIRMFKPEYLWFVGPEFPIGTPGEMRNQSTDEYLLLDLNNWNISGRLRREIHQAERHLFVRYSHRYTSEHLKLSEEMIGRQEMPPLIIELYRSMPKYINNCSSALILEARLHDGQLNGYYVIDQAAKKFDVYLLGAYSRNPYIPHASDLLFYEMIKLAKDNHKNAIQLGLGVHSGIRRFKQKWGGKPYLKYCYAEFYLGSRFFEPFRNIMDGIL